MSRSSMARVFSVFIGTSLFALPAAFGSPSELTSPARELADWLSGTLNSSTQSLNQYSYFDVTVRQCEVQMQGLDGIVLYLEQAISLRQDQPYRVRFVQIMPDFSGDEIVVTNYGVRSSASLRGLCMSAGSPPELSSTQFLGEEKCTVYMKKQGEKYVGSTRPEGCQARSRGASRVTAEVTVTKNGMTSWDRGWDDSGRQVWGAVEGPYRFEKVPEGAQHDPQLTQLGSYLVGRFSNQRQVAQQPDDFLPISYQICHIDFAKEPIFARGNVLHFYAEQEIGEGNRSFTRQSIYSLYRGVDGEIVLRGSSVSEEQKSARLGTCGKSLRERLNTPSQALRLEGSCEVFYTPSQDGKAYVGKTPEGGCASQFRGAVRVEIDEVIADGQLEVLEQWFNAAGELVAGSEAGPYVYVREAYQDGLPPL